MKIRKKLPDSVREKYRAIHGVVPSSDMHTHLKRELMQEIWALLLDDKFMHTYKHGIEILCADNIWRLVFPRLLTYSADYPEK
jgi:hypothetical protein